MTGPGGAGEPAATIRVLAADDQRVVREGLALVLGLLPGVEVVGTAADGDEAIELARDLRPDVILMDLRMPGRDGVAAIRVLRERFPQIKVIVLTTYADDRSVVEALRAGARGYLTKDAGGAEISRALREVLEDRSVIDPAVQHHLVDAIASAAPSGPAAAADRDRAAQQLPGGLTPREVEVLALIAQGLPNAQIARELVVSESTVKSHINHLLPKINARDRAQAVTFAYQHGLLTPGRPGDAAAER
jgi:DNA-binding NarL/FixJ family response regulator